MLTTLKCLFMISQFESLVKSFRSWQNAFKPQSNKIQIIPHLIPRDDASEFPGRRVVLVGPHAVGAGRTHQEEAPVAGPVGRVGLGEPGRGVAQLGVAEHAVLGRYSVMT